MPRPVGYGRPGTPVIPTQWAATHEPVADGTHRAAVTLRRPPALDLDADVTTSSPGATYATNVPAAISAVSDRGQVAALAGEERVDETRYTVSVSSHLPCHEGDDVEVLTDLDDPLLTGRHLNVEQVVLGTARFERDLLCTLVDAPAPPT